MSGSHPERQHQNLTSFSSGGERRPRKRAAGKVIDKVVYLRTYQSDYRSLARYSRELIVAVFLEENIANQDIYDELDNAIARVKTMLRKRQVGQANSWRTQAFNDLVEFRKICYDFVSKVADKGSASVHSDVEERIDRYLEPLIKNVAGVLKHSNSDRFARVEIAILRLQRVAKLARDSFGAASQIEGPLQTGLKSISSEELLRAVAEKERVPESQRSTLCKRVLLSFRKAKINETKLSDSHRPKWHKRPESLRHLTAPMFLKKIYADLIREDGTIVDEDRIRSYDSKLIQVVKQYISKRIERKQDLGDAQGIVLSNKGWKGSNPNPNPKRRSNGGAIAPALTP